MKNHSCPSDSKLFQFLRGGCDETEIEVIADHLETCDDCESKVESIESNAGTLAGEILDLELKCDSSATSPLQPMNDTRTLLVGRDQSGGAKESTFDKTSKPTKVPEDLVKALQNAGYELIGLLGRGAMGIVFEARQIAVDRRVALKVLTSSGVASRAELRRFRNEAESVARMDHPRIVPIYEVGSSLGHDYFTMKLIPGGSLDRKLADYTKNPREGALLLKTVAEAVHHAHERGILHRDLKPANILLDEEGQPHVTDFGIAYRLDGEFKATRTGMLVGTPSFMSPEQASGDRVQLTTSCDVYSLGAVFYAVLTGKAPLVGTSLFQTIDLVRTATPDHPSKHNSQVPRELDLICLKCLEKDPSNRYPDARSLAEDLDRWLTGRPVTVRPIGAIARVWLWALRHPIPAALSAALAASIFIGFGLVAWKWREAERNERKAVKLVRFFSDRVLKQASTEINPKSSNPTLREVLDRSATRVSSDFEEEPEVEASIQETLGSTYASLGEIERAEPRLRRALKLDEAMSGPSDPATLRVGNALASLLVAKGETAEAEALLRSGLKIANAALGPESESALDASERLGGLLRRLKHLDEAALLLRQTVAVRQKVLEPDAPETLRAVRELCRVEIDRGNLKEAETLAFDYQRGIRCAFGPKHPGNVDALTNQGLIRLLRGSAREAEPYYQQASQEAIRILGPDHGAAKEVLDELARVRRLAETQNQLQK